MAAIITKIWLTAMERRSVGQLHGTDRFKDPEPDRARGKHMFPMYLIAIRFRNHWLVGSEDGRPRKQIMANKNSVRRTWRNPAICPSLIMHGGLSFVVPSLPTHTLSLYRMTCRLHESHFILFVFPFLFLKSLSVCLVLAIYSPYIKINDSAFT